MRFLSGLLAIVLIMVVCAGLGAVYGPKYLPQIAGWIQQAPAAQIPADAQPSDSTQLRVTGSGSVEVTPDQAVITLGVSEEHAQVLTAQKNVNVKLNAVVEALTQLGVASEDIATQQLNLNANYDYSSTGSGRLTGYTASSSLTVRTSQLDQAGALVDAALQAGANRLDGISFQLKDDAAARRQALELAAADARQKAEVLAKASGKQLGALRVLAEGGAEAPMPVVQAAYAMDSAAEASNGTSISAGTLTLTATVTAEYALQ